MKRVVVCVRMAFLRFTEPGWMGVRGLACTLDRIVGIQPIGRIQEIYSWIKAHVGWDAVGERRRHKGRPSRPLGTSEKGDRDTTSCERRVGITLTQPRQSLCDDLISLGIASSVAASHAHRQILG